MSETSIHAASTTLCCCNEKVAARTLKEYHWLEIAALISVAILVILSCLAFSQTGAFAHTVYAIPFALCCLGIAGVLIGLEVIYKMIFYIRLVTKGENKEQAVRSSVVRKLDFENMPVTPKKDSFI